MCFYLSEKGEYQARNHLALEYYARMISSRRLEFTYLKFMHAYMAYVSKTI